MDRWGRRNILLLSFLIFFVGVGLLARLLLQGSELILGRLVLFWMLDYRVQIVGRRNILHRYVLPGMVITRSRGRPSGAPTDILGNGGVRRRESCHCDCARRQGGS